MIKLIAACLFVLSLALPARAQIAVDATGTTLDSTAATSQSYTGITVGSGSNRALVVFVAWKNAVTSPTATWDNGGTNQAMTILQSDLGTSPLGTIFGLVNPTPGNKTLLVSWTNSRTSQITAQSYTGVLQTGGTTTWPNATSATGSSTAPSVTVTSATNHMPLNQISEAGSQTISALTQTQIWLDNGANIHAAGQRAAGAASVTFGATLSGTQSWLAEGVDMVQAPAAAAKSSFLPILGVQ